MNKKIKKYLVSYAILFIVIDLAVDAVVNSGNSELKIPAWLFLTIVIFNIPLCFIGIYFGLKSKQYQKNKVGTWIALVICVLAIGYFGWVFLSTLK